MNQGLGGWVVKRAHLNGEHTALAMGDRSYSYLELHELTNRLARALFDLGLRKGDRVAGLMVNSPEFVLVLVACAKLGAIMVPINVRLSAAEIGYILADSGADMLVMDGALAVAGRSALIQPGVRVRSVAVIDGAATDDELAFDSLVAADTPAEWGADVAGGDVALIMYTSGTTGLPKGAMLTHDNLLWNAINVLGTETGLTANDVTINVAPLFHVGGLGVHMLPLLYVGGTNVILPHFDPAATLAAMQHYRATVQFMVPAMWTALTQVAGFDSYDLSALRLAVSGGAPCPLRLIEFLQDRGIPFTEGFGMTETAPLVSVLDSAHVKSNAGSVGRAAMHVQARIVDDTDKHVPADTVGELVVRGPNVFVGYWMKPQATAEAFRSGWFHTGDLGRMDDEGFITLVDRKKDMIISGGENVYPIEVEQVLLAHPGVADAAIIGGPDSKWGERVVAVVVTAPGNTASPGTGDLIAWCRQRLAHFKCPHEVHFVDELPRNATGKLLKRELRRQFTGIEDAVSR
jgi:fatty-acyl-CoA synthase